MLSKQRVSPSVPVESTKPDPFEMYLKSQRIHQGLEPQPEPVMKDAETQTEPEQQVEKRISRQERRHRRHRGLFERHENHAKKLQVLREANHQAKMEQNNPVIQQPRKR